MNRLPQHNRKHRNSGHTILEMLLVITMTAVMSGTGMQLMNVLLRQYNDACSESAESARYRQIITRVQSAFNRRCTNPLTDQPWLILVTGKGHEWYPLQEIRLSVVDNGEPAEWIWNPSKAIQIHVNLPSGEYLGHQPMPYLRIKFPQSEQSFFREGIAIEGFRGSLLLKK